MKRAPLLGRLIFGAAVGSALVLGSQLADLGEVEAASLRPSGASLNRQNREAQAHDYTFLRTSADARRFVDRGYLVPVRPNGDFELKDVSFPVARPEVKLFVDRLSAQYRSACGERLVVTSLTRPRNNQPRNASARSVHPTGMAIDLRRPNNGRCRQWLEGTLLYLEDQGVLEANYERWPPHYHIAVFPKSYKAYVEELDGQPADSAQRAHVVTRGETLWKIASRYSTTVQRVKSANGLRSNRIYPGQRLTIPTG